MTLYIKDRIFHEYAASVAANLPPCPWTGGLDMNAAKIALGERLDLWPESIRADAEANRMT